MNTVAAQSSIVQSGVTQVSFEVTVGRGGGGEKVIDYSEGLRWLDVAAVLAERIKHTFPIK